MHSRTKRMILAVDRILAACSLPVTKEEGVLLTFLFHSLFEGPEETRSGVMHPQQETTVEMFRQIIGHFQKQSYRFVSPEDVLNGLPSRGKYVLLTLDDGYYNNIRALPVLEAFRAPAVLFVSSGHVKQGKAFWWDVVYRENKKRGRTEQEIDRMIAGYKPLRTADVEAQLRDQFGPAALKPVGDLDRPFTPAELRQFARHPLISLGNHTRDHAILTGYSSAEIQEQIQGAQDDIREMTGQSPRTIAYPNGNESWEIVAAAGRAGLCLGIGVHPGRNRLPLRSPEAMRLKRSTLWGDLAIEPQCRTSRSGVSLYRLLYSVRARSSATPAPRLA